MRLSRLYFYSGSRHFPLVSLQYFWHTCHYSDIFLRPGTTVTTKIRYADCATDKRGSEHFPVAYQPIPYRYGKYNRRFLPNSWSITPSFMDKKQSMDIPVTVLYFL